MKKIVFSFDDGLLDFYTNVFPILKKYGVTATLNVTSGFVDGSIKNEWEYCNIDQIKEMFDYGIEIANHSNSHVYPETKEDYAICDKKLKEWIKTDVAGLVTPFTQDVDKETILWCKQNHYKYIRLGSIGVKKTILIKILIKFRLIDFQKYSIKKMITGTRRCGMKIIYSFPVWNNKGIDHYIKKIIKAPKNSTITLMFHSIFNTIEETENCPYPVGAWTISKFIELIEYCQNNKILITTQK